MTIPERIPGLHWLTIGVGVYAVVWIAFEGALWRVLLLAVGTTAVVLLTLIQRFLGGRVLSGRWWLALTAVAGALFGGGTAVVGLLLMVLKTGLHSHGPEFTIREIIWLVAQIQPWLLVGALTGLGLGMLALWRRQ